MITTRDGAQDSPIVHSPAHRNRLEPLRVEGWISHASPTPVPICLQNLAITGYRCGGRGQWSADFDLAGELETSSGGSFVCGQNAAGKLFALGHQEIMLTVIAALGAGVALAHVRLDRLQAQLSRLDRGSAARKPGPCAARSHRCWFRMPVMKDQKGRVLQAWYQCVTLDALAREPGHLGTGFRGPVRAAGIRNKLARQRLRSGLPATHQ
jgi:hypothetical protein